jgi:hypothetical protein
MGRTKGSAVYGLLVLVLVSVAALSCGRTNGGGNGPDDGGPDGTIASCGSSGQPCCNGTACNNGLMCQAGTCGAGSADSGGPEAGRHEGGPMDGGTSEAASSEGGTSEACAGPHCSADLHSVVDCNGNTVTVCPASEGCAGAACVPACQSAASNKTATGCDFYSVTPDVIVPAPGACFAAFLANTWTTPVTLTVEYGSQTLDPTTFTYIPSGTGQATTYAPLTNGQIPPGAVAIVFLDDDPMPAPGEGLNFACPAGVTAAMTTDSAVHGTGLGTAFHIGTSAPVAAYDIFPYGGGQSAVTSATLLLPTAAWSTNYIAVDAFAGGPTSLSMGEPFIEIVAMTANTTVTINPTAAIAGGTGVADAAQGVSQSYTLNAGQVLQFTQNDELQGSVIQATSPVGVWGGITCLNIDLMTCCCDSAHQQIPPIQTFGHEYVAVRYRNRFTGTEEFPPWRIVGAVNGTTLTYDPPLADAGAPTTVGSGQTLQFDTNGPFVVSSQDALHPFYMSAHMTGADTVNPTETDGRGDPEFVNIIPPAEYVESYVFFTDPTYSETDLVVVRVSGPTGFQEVTLDCLGTLTGWAPVGTSGKYEYTRVDLVTGDFMPIGNCNNGRHEMTSSTPFGLTVWGWGSAATGGPANSTDAGVDGGFNTQYVSYAYPAGASLQQINSVVVPP